jgi:tetratricopeptide (TPR) repeat protein
MFPSTWRPAHEPALTNAGFGQRALPRTVFWPLLVGLLLAGMARSWFTTRLDSFTIDEAWHAAAGASYASTGDYRLNPEHPPLVKLWVGVALIEDGFRLPAFRPLPDKEGERAFINEAIYLMNDPDVVQRRVRVAMLGLHALLLLGVALSLERVMGGVFSLAAMALLLLDPTVAAHLPVVLTDLPVALLSVIVFVQAAVALRSWRATDLALLSLSLGVTLSAKHSGLVTALGLALVALMFAVLPGRGARPGVLRRLASVGAVFAGAYVVLWAFYGFRFLEGGGGEPSALLFNRSMADKIADLSSGTHRAFLQLAVDGHLLPRAYLWGLADILRAGLEGRQESLYIFGKVFEGMTPWYVFPSVLLFKLPLGVSALGAIAAVLLARRRVPEPWRLPLALLLGWGGFFLVFLVRGNSGYAGIRHALPVIPVVVVFAAGAVVLALDASSRLFQGAVALLSLAAIVSARPALRPWEYYNELAGGSVGAWRHFADDGLDNSQRTRELAAYYDQHLRGTAEPVYDFYGVFGEESQARRLTFSAIEDDASDSDVLQGTVFLGARELAERPSYDYDVFRAAEPAARFGNLLVYQGQFRIPWLRAARRWSLISVAQSEAAPDQELIARLLEEVVALYPQDIRASFELGNLMLERGAREQALAAYRRARDNAPEGNNIVGMLSDQIDALARGESAAIAPLRNPWLE